MILVGDAMLPLRSIMRNTAVVHPFWVALSRDAITLSGGHISHATHAACLACRIAVRVLMVQVQVMFLADMYLMYQHIEGLVFVPWLLLVRFWLCIANTLHAATI